MNLDEIKLLQRIEMYEGEFENSIGENRVCNTGI